MEHCHGVRESGGLLYNTIEKLCVPRNQSKLLQRETHQIHQPARDVQAFAIHEGCNKPSPMRAFGIAPTMPVIPG